MTTQGAFVWYELMTTDMAAAEAFYTDVVGWTAADSGMAGMDYTLFKMGERMVAGSMTLPQDAAAMGVPPCWTGYVAADDVDATAKAMKADGAAIHKGPADIPGVGRFAVMADPQGAAFCLFKGDGTFEAQAPATPGTIGWHELYTSDLEAGFAFYAKHFGWTKADAMDMGEMGVYQMFAHEGVPIGGMMTRPPHLPVSAWSYYFNVPAIDPALDKVKALGGQVLHGPQPVPGGSIIAQCSDPQGVFFCMVAPGVAA